MAARQDPIVAGIRISAAADTGEAQTDGPIEAPASDLAWHAAASPLTGDTLVTVAPGPDPVLAAVNPGTAEVSLLLEAQGGADITLVVPAGGSASTPVVAGTTYVLREPSGLSVAIGYGVPVLPKAPVIGKFFPPDVTLPTQVTSWSIIVSFAVATATGLIFGIYPAKMAARQDPIVALRHD